MWDIAKLIVLPLMILSSSLFAYEFQDSAIALGMGGAYSVVGHENGLLKANPATIADTHPLYSINSYYSRLNDAYNTTYLEVSALDSTGSLAGGAYFGRIMNSASDSNRVKIDNAYMALSEHYTDALYFGIGATWIRDYEDGSHNWEFTAGMMARLGDFFRAGVCGYNLLSYENEYFPKMVEFSLGLVTYDIFRGEIDYLQNLDAGWGFDNATLKVGTEVLIANILGITAGWRWENFSKSAFSGGIYWRYPRGIVAYSFSTSATYGETHSLSVEFFVIQ